MTFQILNGISVPNIPWEERPAECAEVVWRSNFNPIIPRNLIPKANRYS